MESKKINFKSGLVVRIKVYDEENIPDSWCKNPMKEFMGKIVTISHKTLNPVPFLQIIEDRFSNKWGWAWGEDDFQKVNTL